MRPDVWTLCDLGGQDAGVVLDGVVVGAFGLDVVGCVTCRSWETLVEVALHAFGVVVADVVGAAR